MDDTIHELSEYLVKRLDEISVSQRLIIGITGIPSSGKSTLARHVVAGCNRLLNHKFATASSSAIGVDSITSFADAATHSDDTAPRGDLDEDEDKDRLLVPPNTAVSTSDSDAGVEWRLEGTLTPAAIAISQDGWSYPSSYLDSFPDPSLAHARRGTHWTYDGPAYAAFVSALRQPLSAHQPSTLSFSGGIVSNNGETDVHDLSLIYAPTSTSSHRGGDPVCQPQPILPAHRIILIEGPYTLLDQGAFSQAARLLDERWVLECSESVAMDRIVSKHVESRHLGNEEGVRRTAKDNYMPNGRFLMRNLFRPTRWIQNVDDIALAHMRP